MKLTRLGSSLLIVSLVACTTTSPRLHDEPHGRRPSRNGAEEFRRLILQDERGEIPRDAMTNALRQIAAMKAHQQPDTAGVTRGSWTWLGPGNIGGRITTILINPNDPNKLFVNNPGGGIWKSSNAGATFQPVNDFLANLSVSTLAMNPTDNNIMYAGTGGGTGGSLLRGAGIFKSTDGGTTWTQLASTASPTWSDGVEKIAISPDGNVVLAAAKSQFADSATAIYRSTDGGAAWTETLQQPGLDGVYVEFEPTNSSRVIASTKQGQAFYSRDGGLTWSAATGIPADGLITLAYARSNPSIVYAGVNQNGGDIYQSTDGGVTYTLVNSGTKYLGDQGWYCNVVWVDPTNPNTVLIAGLDIYRSTDGGANFTKISKWQKAPRSAHADHGAIAAAAGYGTSNNTVYFGNDGGLYRVQDLNTVEETAGWDDLNNNLGVTQIYGASANPSTGVIMAGTQDNGSIRSSGDVQKWTRWQGGDGGFIAADPTDSNIFYGEYVYLTIYRSSDGGVERPDDIYGKYDYWNGSSWEKKTRPNPITEAKSGTANFIAPFILDPNDPNRLLAGARSLWVSNNARIPKEQGWPEWTAIKPPAGDSRNNNISAIAVARGNANVIWAGHNNGDVFVTSDGLSTKPSWTKADDGGTPLPNRFVTRLVVDPNDAQTAYATFGGFSANNIWRTRDGGASWASITGSGASQLPRVPVETLQIHPKNSRWLYAGTEVGIFTSEDGGATWTIPQDGPANVSVKELFWLGTTLYAATFGRGIYKIDITNAAAKSVETCYTLAIDADSETRGGVVADVAPNCSHGTQYTAGTKVTLRARPRAPFGLARWSGDAAGNARTTMLVMNGNKSAAAHFTTTAACVPLTITVTPPGSGSVTTDPAPNCNGGFTAGTEVILNVTPADGYAFGGWTGDYFGPDPDASITMDEPASITAIFAVPAPNDDFAKAVVVSDSFSATIDTSAATNEPSDPDLCEAGKGGRTVWFAYLAHKDGQLRIDTNGSNYHTIVQVYSGLDRPALKSVGCRAQALPGTPISDLEDIIATDELAGIIVTVKKGNAYMIEIADGTEPDLEQQDDDNRDFELTDDGSDSPEGGLLQINVQFAPGLPRPRAVHH